MAAYRIVSEGQEGHKYAYHCEVATGDQYDGLPFRCAPAVKKLTIVGEAHHCEESADKAIAREIAGPPEPIQFYDAEEITQILQEKNVIAGDEEFSENMDVRVAPAEKA